MSSVSLYVGNLPFNVSQENLRELFSPFGLVSVAFAPGRHFAYVEVSECAADSALASLNGHQIGEHELLVKKADYTEPRTMLP